MPTATDLVTDLPADFETFGQAVATSMADLLGGTTGQILSKASNTDMDFTWVTNDVGDITAVNTTAPLAGGGTSGALTLSIAAATTSVAGAVQLSDSTSTTSSVLAATPTAVKSAYDLANGAIPKTLIDAAGDLIVGTAADTAGRLGIGTAGQVLKVNSGATALEWAAAGAASGMTLIARTDFSNVASQAFDGVFTSTYRTYLVVVEKLFAATAGDDCLIQLRYAGPTTETAGYYQKAAKWNGSSWAGLSSGAGSSFSISDVCGSNADYLTGQIYFNGVGNTSEQANMNFNSFDSYTAQTVQTGGGVLATNRTWTGLLFKSSSSNITGRIAIYGLAV
jgi:hypothetical protein